MRCAALYRHGGNRFHQQKFLSRLRRREPDTPRPFRAWGYPASAALVVAGAVVFLAGVLVSDTPSALKAFGLLAVGLIGRAVATRWMGKPAG